MAGRGEGAGLSFGGGLAPQEAGVSVTVFCYVRRAGGQEGAARASRETESKTG